LLQALEDQKLDQHGISMLSDRSRDPRVIPAMEKGFGVATTKEKKQSFALALIRAGVRDEAYFEYLAGFAKEAIESRAPLIYALDEKGVPRRGVRNPEFDLWCNQENKDVLEESGRQLGIYPTDVSMLVMAVDTRSSAIFLQGLNSSNRLIISLSAAGLADLGNLDTVRPIVSAALRSRVNIDVVIGKALAGFDQPGAQVQIDAALKGSRLYPTYRAAVELRSRQRNK
jgi:hypothetical protein